MKHTISVISLSAMLAVTGCGGRYYVVGSHVYQLDVADQVYQSHYDSWKKIDATPAFIARLKQKPAFTSEFRAFEQLEWEQLQLERQQEQQNRGKPSPKHSDQTTTGRTPKIGERDETSGGGA